MVLRYRSLCQHQEATVTSRSEAEVSHHTPCTNTTQLLVVEVKRTSEGRQRQSRNTIGMTHASRNFQSLSRLCHALHPRLDTPENEHHYRHASESNPSTFFIHLLRRRTNHHLHALPRASSGPSQAQARSREGIFPFSACTSVIELPDDRPCARYEWHRSYQSASQATSSPPSLWELHAKAGSDQDNRVTMEKRDLVSDISEVLAAEHLCLGGNKTVGHFPFFSLERVGRLIACWVQGSTQGMGRRV